jgi:hypothetical protein
MGNDCAKHLKGDVLTEQMVESMWRDYKTEGDATSCDSIRGDRAHSFVKDLRGALQLDTDEESVSSVLTWIHAQVMDRERRRRNGSVSNGEEEETVQKESLNLIGKSDYLRALFTQVDLAREMADGSHLGLMSDSLISLFSSEPRNLSYASEVYAMRDDVMPEAGFLCAYQGRPTRCLVDLDLARRRFHLVVVSSSAAAASSSDGDGVQLQVSLVDIASYRVARTKSGQCILRLEMKQKGRPARDDEQDDVEVLRIRMSSELEGVQLRNRIDESLHTLREEALRRRRLRQEREEQERAQSDAQQQNQDVEMITIARDVIDVDRDNDVDPDDDDDA